jgi:peptide/nickel transport system permease protein
VRGRGISDLRLLLGLVCVGSILLLAAGGGLVSGHDASTQDLLHALEPPFQDDGFLLGTDHLGRDLLARLTSGARVSLVVAGCVVMLSGLIGVVVGAVSGYFSGIRDVVIQKVVEAFSAFPPILLAIAVLAFFGQSLTNVVVALTIQRWIPYCRIARAQTLALSSREYIAAAKILGGSTSWILLRHVVPNLMPSAIIVASFTMATAVLAESSLSFLGLGVPPSVVTWGGMLAEGRSYITQAWWIAVFPGLGIFVTVLGLNLLGDWLRDQFDPKRGLDLR